MGHLKTIEDDTREANTADVMAAIGQAARKAAHALSLASAATKNLAIRKAANTIRARAADILAANARDMAAAKANGTASAFLDRLALDESRVEAMAKGLDDIAALPDPVGRLLARSSGRTGF